MAQFMERFIILLIAVGTIVKQICMNVHEMDARSIKNGVFMVNAKLGIFDFVLLCQFIFRTSLL